MVRIDDIFVSYECKKEKDWIAFIIIIYVLYYNISNINIVILIHDFIKEFLINKLML